MKLVTYTEKNSEKVGVLSPDMQIVHPIAKYATMLDLIEDDSNVRENVIQEALTSSSGVPVETVRLEAPIPHPRRDIIAVGLNYMEHAMESAKFKGIEFEKPEAPVYFSKRVNRAVGPGQPVPSHREITTKLDYEVELAVIIGSRCDHVSREDAFSHVFGYTIVNDISARDLQNLHIQYSFAKGLDGFAPMGPWIVTADEFKAPPHLTVKTLVNGEVRQNSNTKDFIFDIPHMISELSGGIVLEPGEIIITGTPSGVGMGMNPPTFLQVGDEVVCEIEGIGQLKNTIK